MEIKNRMKELEAKQKQLLEDYFGIAELIAEDIEEQDLLSLRIHVADIDGILQDLNAVKTELSHLCDAVKEND